MKTRLNGILTLLLVLIVQISFAQEKTVSGTVSDNSGALPGVSVLIKGTTTGTETDFDGKYTIKVKTGDVISFSYLGYVTLERTVGSSNTINVTLAEDSNVLDEVVVVGYGTSTKQSFTGTAKVVKAAVLENKSVSNISQALAGEIAGVNVITSSGQPGTSATVRIRGFGSVNGNRAPLYVVDGVPFFGALNSINPSDIESTTVLKDATATAIYGARGANGVILITTKTGKNGVSTMEVDVKTGVNFSLIPRYDLITSPEEYIEVAWASMGGRGENFGNDAATYANTYLFSSRGIDPKYNLWNVASASELIDPTTGKVRSGVTRKYNPENWQDLGFQSSIRTEANLKMSGGNDKTKYFSSFGYLDDIGYVINSKFKRVSTRLNLTHKPKEWLTASTSLGYTLGETVNNGQTNDSGSIFWFADNIPSIYPVYERDANGALIPDLVYGGNVFDYGVGRGFGALTNSIGDATHNFRGNKRHSLNGNFSFDIKFSENLSFQTKYGIQYYNQISNTYNNPFYGSGAPADVAGSLTKGFNTAVAQNFLNMFTYKNTFGDHSIQVLLAHETNQWKRSTSSVRKTTIVNLNNGITDLDNYIKAPTPASGQTDETALESFFAQANYNFNGKYFATGSIRRDGSSRFANQKWGTFGSVGLAWLVSEEDFFSDVSVVDYLKAKVSYGLVGDQAGVGFYSGQDTYSINNLDGGISLGVRAKQNPDLTWETSKMFQAGIEFGILKNRIEGSFDYYLKDTDDLIFNRRVGPSVGDALLTVNDGSLRNSGFEFDVTGHIIDKKDYKLDFTINGAALSNELTAMPIDPATGEQKVLDQNGNYGRAVGHSIFDFYMREWAGVDPSDGSAMWNQYYHDANGNNMLDAGEGIQSLAEYKSANPSNAISKTITKTYADATEKYIGKSVIPAVSGAFRLNAKIHNFDISTQFRYSIGGHAYDFSYSDLLANDQIGNNNWHKDIQNRWKQPGDISDIPKLKSNLDTRVNAASSRFVQSSDYLTLNNVRIGYSLPNKFIQGKGISNVNIWLSGDNLFLLSARQGFNPSTSETGASQRYNYAPLTTLSLGVRVKF